MTFLHSLDLTHEVQSRHKISPPCWRYSQAWLKCVNPKMRTPVPSLFGAPVHFDTCTSLQTSVNLRSYAASTQYTHVMATITVDILKSLSPHAEFRDCIEQCVDHASSSSVWSSWPIAPHASVLSLVPTYKVHKNCESEPVKRMLCDLRHRRWAGLTGTQWDCGMTMLHHRLRPSHNSRQAKSSRRRRCCSIYR